MFAMQNSSNGIVISPRGYVEVLFLLAAVVAKEKIGWNQAKHSYNSPDSNE
jgi:hypothetical protein